jgi:FMN phosphatase YigB (HAD superfamily)
LKKTAVTLLLFDLDDTLLENHMESFLPAYLQGLAKRMSGVAKPEHLIQSLLEATQAMVLNQRPDLTLEEKFDAVFFPALGLHRHNVQRLIDSFYQEDFPALASLTASRPGARTLVQQGFERGYQVAIATNPLFPRTAILQRLAWAGLSVGEFAFILVPSYETFHFAKPNPAFYAELLAQIGWPEGPVIMAGDDLERDILPASRLGLPVFWVTNKPSSWSGAGSPPTHGDLDDLLPWLDGQPEAALSPDYTQLEALKAILRSTPAALQTILKSLPHAILARRPVPSEWSTVEILCHLRDVEREVNLPRLHKLITTTNPFIAGQDTDQWANERKYIQQDCLEAQDAFMQARLELLCQVDSLTEEDWNRPFRHAIFGPSRLREMINIIAGHDRLHIRQVFETLKIVFSMPG